MNKYLSTFVFLCLSSCAPHIEQVDIIKGPKGDPGTSCSAAQSEGGVLISCGGSEALFVSNGTPGADGEDGEDGSDGSAGQDGQPGEDGQDGAPGADGTSSGLMSEIELNGCTPVAEGRWAKLIGQGSLKVYSNQWCNGNSVASLSSTDEVHILAGGDLLLFQSQTNSLYKLVF